MIIQKQLNISLPKEELSGIAMNIINSELYSSLGNTEQNLDLLIEKNDDSH